MLDIRGVHYKKISQGKLIALAFLIEFGVVIGYMFRPLTPAHIEDYVPTVVYENPGKHDTILNVLEFSRVEQDDKKDDYDQLFSKKLADGNHWIRFRVSKVGRESAYYALYYSEDLFFVSLFDTGVSKGDIVTVRINTIAQYNDEKRALKHSRMSYMVKFDAVSKEGISVC